MSDDVMIWKRKATGKAKEKLAPGSGGK